MKLIKTGVLGFVSLIFIATAPSCSSDPNPVGYLNVDGSQVGEAYIELNFSVKDTRADNMASDAEQSISKVNIYVFDKNNTFEECFLNQEVTNDKVSLQVTPGVKSIYAVTANSTLVSQPAEGSNFTAFESQIVNSKLSDLKTNDGFVMVGKIENKEIKEFSTSPETQASNNCTIELERLLAKVQVKNNIDLMELPSAGLPSLEKACYKVFQTNNKMYLTAGNSDAGQPYEDKATPTGTHDNYTFDDGSGYITAISQTSTFTNGDCQYMPENVVSSPVSGNTTFVAVRFAATPYKAFTMSGSNLILSNCEQPANPITFYTIAVINKETKKMIDFVWTKAGTINYICCFTNKSDAESFVSKNSSNLPSNLEYEVFTYTDGYTYYRINIKDDSDANPQVLRNKFYKITLNSVKTLGMPSVEKLCPTDANSDLDEGAADIGGIADASFTVTPWSQADQTVEDL